MILRAAFVHSLASVVALGRQYLDCEETNDEDEDLLQDSLGQRCYQFRLAAATATSERPPVLHQLRSKSHRSFKKSAGSGRVDRNARRLRQRTDLRK